MSGDPFREFFLASMEHEEAHKTNDVSRVRKANARLLAARFEARGCDMDRPRRTATTRDCPTCAGTGAAP